MSRDEKKGGKYEQPVSREMVEDDLDEVAGGADAEAQPPCEAGSSANYGNTLCNEYPVCRTIDWRMTPRKA